MDRRHSANHRPSLRNQLPTYRGRWVHVRSNR
nr:MAG TPA: hypothetical protein [Caudoviricetes sp.]